MVTALPANSRYFDSFYNAVHGSRLKKSPLDFCRFDDFTGFLVFACTEEEFVFIHPVWRSARFISGLGAVHDYLCCRPLLFEPVFEIHMSLGITVGYADVKDYVGGMHSLYDDEGVLGFFVLVFHN